MSFFLNTTVKASLKWGCICSFTFPIEVLNFLRLYIDIKEIRKDIPLIVSAKNALIHPAAYMKDVMVGTTNLTISFDALRISLYFRILSLITIIPVNFLKIGPEKELFKLKREFTVVNIMYVAVLEVAPNSHIVAETKHNPIEKRSRTHRIVIILVLAEAAPPNNVKITVIILVSDSERDSIEALE